MKNGNSKRITIERTKDYKVIGIYHLNDKDLSLEAKGLLTYMLTRPENWSFSIEGLAIATKTTKYKIRELLKELKSLSYLEIKEDRKNGKIQYSYYIYEKSKRPYIDFQHTENTSIELIIELLKDRTLEQDKRNILIKRVKDFLDKTNIWLKDEK